MSIKRAVLEFPGDRPMIQADPTHPEPSPIEAGSPSDYRQTLQPFRQGELDGLCGIYAIINAVRWAAGPKVISTAIVEELFWVLTQHAIKEQGNLSICTDGILLPQLRQLMRVAFRYLKQEYAHRFTVAVIKGPDVVFEPTERAPALEVLPNEAIILNLKSSVWHWSVFQGVQPGKLKLFDSARWRTLSLPRVSFMRSFRVTYLPEQSQEANIAGVAAKSIL